VFKMDKNKTRQLAGEPRPPGGVAPSFGIMVSR
jgi:hypothetical protein